MIELQQIFYFKYSVSVGIIYWKALEKTMLMVEMKTINNDNFILHSILESKLLVYPTAHLYLFYYFYFFYYYFYKIFIII